MKFKSTSPWRNSSKSKPRLLPVPSVTFCLLYGSESVPAGCCLVLSVPAFMPESYKGFCVVFIEQGRKHHIGEGMGDTSHTSLTEFSRDKVTSCPITLDNKQRLLSNVHVLSTLMSDIHCMKSFQPICCFYGLLS